MTFTTYHHNPSHRHVFLDLVTDYIHMCSVPTVHSQCYGYSDPGTVFTRSCHSSALPISYLTENNMGAFPMTDKALHNLAQHSVSKHITHTILSPVTRAPCPLTSDFSLLFSLTSSQICSDQPSTFFMFCFNTTLSVRNFWTTSYLFPASVLPSTDTYLCVLPLLSRLWLRPPLNGKLHEPWTFV